jgi:hypothetical protein
MSKLFRYAALSDNKGLNFKTISNNTPPSYLPEKGLFPRRIIPLEL